MFLVDNGENVNKGNIHWRLMSEDYCNFCELDYDYIGELDNVECELDYILRRAAGVKKTIPIPTVPYPYNNKQDELKKIPQDLLQKVVKVYRDDFDMFGYPLP